MKRLFLSGELPKLKGANVPMLINTKMSSAIFADQTKKPKQVKKPKDANNCDH